MNPEYKQWVVFLRQRMPGEMKIERYYDGEEKHSVEVLSCVGDGGKIVATIGLMDVDLSDDPEQTVFCELMMDVSGVNEAVDTVVATAALSVLGTGRKVAPGVVYEQMVEMYCPDLPVKHLWFISPFQWGEELLRVELENKTILPLLGVPITEAEFDYIKENGPIALEKLMAESQCDVFDWRRESAV